MRVHTIHRKDPARFMPPLVTTFLAQLADAPGVVDANTLSYAASVIMPLTGWRAEEFVPRLMRELSGAHNLAVLERARQQQLKGIFAPFVLRLSCDKGPEAELMALPRPANTRDGQKTISTAIIPAPANMVRNSDAQAEWTRIMALLDVFPAYIMLIDRDHVIRFDNRVSRQFFGQAKGLLCYQALHDRHTPCTHCPPFSVFSANAIQVHEWASPKTNTAFRVHSYPFEGMDGQKMVLKIGLNITAGVRAQHALDLSEQRYQSIADNLTLGIALLDSDLNTVSVNPKLMEWFGDGASAGASVCDMLHNRCCAAETEGAEHDDATCMLHMALRTKENQEKEFSLLTGNAEIRHFRLVACPILTRKKDVRAVLMMLEDITDRHNLTTRMQHLRRLEAMGSLAGGIAHEINQPLSALHLYASGLQMLLEQGEEVPTERLLERLGLILRQAEKIQQIISHMRALVMQDDNATPTGVSLPEAVEGALALVGTQLLVHNITVRVALPEDLPLVHANPVQLEQVLINLLINAMHALDTVERPEKTIDIDLGVCEPGIVRVRVVDNGPGIQGAEDRIFDPFFTTKSAHKGMGLGLSIVHAFITSWGGDIRVRGNGVKPGAAFTLSLLTAQPSETKNAPDTQALPV